MKYWRNVHRWIGFVIGIQVLLWISGGVVMSIIPIDMVRGVHLIERLEVKVTPDVLPHASVALDHTQWRSLQWRKRNHQAVIKGTDFEGQDQWLDPFTGQKLAPLSAAVLQRLAMEQYRGDANHSTIHRLDEVPAEAGSLTLPLYRVDFDDWIHTSFYLDPASGQIKRVRSDLWRLFDFFWMLHIMDYQEREDFNNPLLIGASLIALLFTFSGLVLLYFTLLRPKAKKWARKLATSS